MQTDTNLLFTGGNTGAAQAIAAAPVRSTGIYDLSTGLMNTGATFGLGVTGGSMLQNAANVFAEDLGPGNARLRFAALIATAFLGGTSLNIQLQGAPDNSAGAYPANFSALVWQTYAETGAIPLANLGVAPGPAALSPDRSIITLPDWPDRPPGAAMPRFVSLLYVPVGTFTAGSIGLAGMFTFKPDFNAARYYGGFTVAP